LEFHDLTQALCLSGQMGAPILKIYDCFQDYFNAIMRVT
jgi:hypothetical protein